MMTKPEMSAPASPLKVGRSPAVKAGGMRVAKKLENAPVEKSAKIPGREKTSSLNVIKMQSMSILLSDALVKPELAGTQFQHLASRRHCHYKRTREAFMLRHKFPAAASQHEKPRPTLEKIILPRRLCIIQQPRKC